MEKSLFLSYAGYDWRPLLSFQEESLARALQGLDPYVQFRSDSILEEVCNRFQREREGTLLTLVLCQGDTPLGWAGATDWQGSPCSLASAAYLLPELWGTGAAGLCRMVYWEISQWCGRRLFIAVHPENTRSILAARKVWPSGWRLLPEPWKASGRMSWVHQITENPGSGPEFTAKQREILGHILKDQPGSRMKICNSMQKSAAAN